MAHVAVMRVRHADCREEELVFAAGRFEVGRESGDIVLASDTQVSALHAVLEVEPRQVTIIDAGSTNGTFDEHGLRLSAPHRLLVGQPVQLGSSMLTLARLLPVSGRTEVAPAAPRQGPRPPRQGVGSGRSTPPITSTPSLTKGRYQEALDDLRFWRRLLAVLGIAFVMAIVVATVLLLRSGDSAGSSLETLLSGLTAIASGGALAWVVKRRDEATDAERTAFREAALGTTAVGALEQASREPPLRSSSAGFR